jgi:hypothetical protein
MHQVASPFALHVAQHLSGIAMCVGQVHDSQRAASSLAFESITATPSGGAANASAEPVTVAILHGLLGQGRNWRTWGRRLATTAADLTQRCSVLLPPLPTSRSQSTAAVANW